MFCHHNSAINACHQIISTTTAHHSSPPTTTSITAATAPTTPLLLLPLDLFLFPCEIHILCGENHTHVWWEEDLKYYFWITLHRACIYLMRKGSLGDNQWSHMSCKLETHHNLIWMTLKLRLTKWSTRIVKWTSSVLDPMRESWSLHVSGIHISLSLLQANHSIGHYWSTNTNYKIMNSVKLLHLARPKPTKLH